MKFTITIREVHVSYREVEADTWRAAVEKAQDLGTEVSCEYSHTPDHMPVDIASHVHPTHSCDDYVEESDQEKDKVR